MHDKYFQWYDRRLIFSDMIEDYLKVLMDNIFVFGNSSKVCLTYLGAVPECCHKKKNCS